MTNSSNLKSANLMAVNPVAVYAYGEMRWNMPVSLMVWHNARWSCSGGTDHRPLNQDGIFTHIYGSGPVYPEQLVCLCRCALSGSLSHQYLSYHGAQPVENGSPVVSRTPIRLSNIFELSVRIWIDISIIFASTLACHRTDERCWGWTRTYAWDAMKKARISTLKAQESCVTLHQFELKIAVTTVTDNRGIHLVIHDRTVLPSKKLSNCLSICCLVRLNEDRWSEK
jgi:hypothetical protein